MDKAAALAMCLWFSVAPPASAAPSQGNESVASARQRLETARAALTKAVERIQGDAPTIEDLDAAHAAIGKLKEAIDAGAEQEPNDLDYAKAALAARKELRTGREYVEQRRAKVHIFNLRRSLGQQLAALDERMRPLKARAPSPQDFDNARAAMGAMRKSLQDAQQFARDDASFARYLSDSEAAITGQEKAIDDRWLALSADKQRGLLDDSRKGLTASMAKLDKSSTDAQFDAADRAANLVTQRLNEGKPLEAKDEGYRSAAAKARLELTQATKRLADLLSQSGLARLQAEIEPARKDLVAAQQGLRGRNPSPDQLAEARTAAIVVRKLVERYQPQASRSPPLAQYVAEVKKTLMAVEVDLQRRTIDSAQGDLNKALAALERRGAADEEFKRVDSAMGALQKTIEAAPRDPDLAKALVDGRALLRDAKARIAKRHLELDVQLQRAKVDTAKKSASALIADLWKANAGDEQLKAAAKGVDELKAALAEGAVLAHKDHDYAVYATEMAKKATDYAERIASRKVQIASHNGRTLLNDSMANAKAKLEAAQAPQTTDADLGAAAQLVEALGQAIEERKSLERQDKGYASTADRARGQLVRFQDMLESVRQAVALRKATGVALASGNAAVESAGGTADLHVQAEEYEKARSQFQSCADEGRTLATTPALGKIAVVVDGKASTAKDVVALCAEHARSSEKRIHELKGLIRFDERMKKNYEAAKSLLAHGRKGDAAGQFGECFVEGLIIQSEYPELKERPLQVGGGQPTLSALTEECRTQKKQLAPN